MHEYLHRNGVGASCVGTPSGNFASMLDFLVQRFPTIAAHEWQARFVRGDVLNVHGKPLHLHAPYVPASKVYYFRSLQRERHIPFEHTVLYQDAYIVVADKPHFLPVVPSGKYVQETLLVRLKRQLNIDTLAPAHRIDRDTAGLVLFTVQPQQRGAYQALFRKQLVHKTYEAVAPLNPALQFPLERTSRIQSSATFMCMTEVPGLANAHTQIELLQTCGALAHVRLRPRTGQRHQLRVHMLALGMPILNDQIYPQLLPEVADDDAAWQARYQSPLQLLAKRLAFTDPITGMQRTFESTRTLRWPVDETA
jgi:tRNA pseudouridine32 synthase / 23S rRNA pseudouridine746 synthase